MKAVLFRPGIVMALAALAACTAPGPRTGTEVTRFHRDEPIVPQPVNLEPANAADEQSLEYRAYQTIVANELTRLGFEPVDGDESALIGIVQVTQTMEMQAPKRSPFSIGIGGGSYGSSGGMGVGTSTNVGGSGGGEVTVTELQLRLVNRADKNVIWEGRAVRTTEPGASNRPTDTVQMLATALFQDFPGKSGSTTTIP